MLLVAICCIRSRRFAIEFKETREGAARKMGKNGLRWTWAVEGDLMVRGSSEKTKEAGFRMGTTLNG